MAQPGCDPLVLNSPERRHLRRKVVEFVENHEATNQKVGRSNLSCAPFSPIKTQFFCGLRQSATRLGLRWVYREVQSMSSKWTWLVRDGHKGFYCSNCKTKWSQPVGKYPNCGAWVGGVCYQLGGWIWVLFLVSLLCYALFQIVQVFRSVVS